MNSSSGTPSPPGETLNCDGADWLHILTAIFYFRGKEEKKKKKKKKKKQLSALERCKLNVSSVPVPGQKTPSGTVTLTSPT
jgi:hypothetical protein